MLVCIKAACTRELGVLVHLGRKNTDVTVLFKKFCYLQFATGTGVSRALAKRGIIPAAPPGPLGQGCRSSAPGTGRFFGGWVGGERLSSNQFRTEAVHYGTARRVCAPSPVVTAARAAVLARAGREFP